MSRGCTRPLHVRQLGHLWVAQSKILRWGPPVQGLVGPEGVVGAFPGQEGLIEGGSLQFPAIDLIELLGVGAVGPLHMPIELGGVRWQDKQAKALSVGKAAQALAVTTARPIKPITGSYFTTLPSYRFLHPFQQPS